MEKETKALNKILVKHKMPITKTPVIAYGRKTKRMYYNTFTKARGENLEEVVGKEIYDKNGYTIINRKGYCASRYICYEIPKSDIICFAELIIHLSGIERADSRWTLYNVALLNKKKESLSAISFSSEGYVGSIPVIYDSETTSKECKNYIKEFAKNEPIISDKLGKIYGTCVDSHYWYYNPCSNFCTSMQKALKATEDGKVGINGETYAELADVISKFFGGKIKNISGSKVVDITASPENLKKYLMYKEPKGMTAENIKKDKFLNIKLKDIKYNPSYDSCVGFIERVNDNMCVLRTMKKNDEEKVMNEICKIFIDKKKAYAYKKNDFDNWCKMRLSISVDTLNFKLTGFESKNTDGTMLEYFGKIIEDIPENKRDVILKLLIVDPFLEQLLKSEFKEFVLYCLLNPYENFDYNAWMTKYFGKVDKTQKGFYKKLGLNKYQTEWFARLYTKNKEKAADVQYRWFEPPFLSINCFSQIFNTNFNLDRSYYYRNEIEYVDISFLDNKSFEMLANTFKNGARDRYISNNRFLENNFPHIIYKLYGLSTLVNMIDYIKYFNKVAKKDWHAASYYRDYFSMVNKMCTFEDFDKSAYKPYFDKNKVIESITSMHDIVTELYNVKRSEISIKAFKKATEKLTKWTYEDGDFTVIAPQKPDDLAIEGTTLHHCVKSYIGRVTEGYTNIMFIRKISDKSKPFFTVEVSNSGAIEQVHGSCNCNVENGSDLEKFVKNWAKNKKLKLTNFNKIR